MGLLGWIFIGCALGALVLYAIGAWCARRHFRIAPVRCTDAELPPVSLLKPIKGLEETLEANLRTFFEQDYPAPFELVFASTDSDDPGIALARRVAADYPHVPVRFVRSDDSFGLNPKVANLAGALRAASHDLVLQSDANVRVRRDYLRRVVGELEGAGASLLSSLVVGVEERSVGAAMENLQLSAFTAPGMCAALHLGGIHCVVGKTMLLRRSELEGLGGLEQVRDVLAEDYILGERYRHAGRKVLLSTTPAENVNRNIGIERFVARHSRWLKMRAVIHLGGFVADLGANPVALALAAVLVSGFAPKAMLALVAIAAVKAAADGGIVRLTRGRPMRPRYLLVAPLKDAVMGAVWVYSCFSRTVRWRGTLLRLGPHSRIHPDDAARLALSNAARGPDPAGKGS